MKLAASQIAWLPQEDDAAAEILAHAGFAGMEIAPTRVAGDAPYEHPDRAADFAQHLLANHGLRVCSMQSIWYGQQGSMFGPERAHFLRYTKAAILFAQAAGAGNLVFGNPKNRSLPAGESAASAEPFFKELGDFAAAHGTVLALEANPAVYGTNFINETADAFAMAGRVASPGFRVNLDVGTMLVNREAVALLRGRVGGINHVHISEPELAAIAPRPLHRELAALLREEGYGGYVSIEMRQQPLAVLAEACAYVAEVFG